MTQIRTATQTHTPLQTQLIGLGETSTGFSASEVTGISPEQVRRCAQGLVKSGELVRERVGARAVRYFRSAELARAYQANLGAARKARAPLPGPRSKASWSVDTPAIITRHTKITIAPPLPRRVLKTNTYLQF